MNGLELHPTRQKRVFCKAKRRKELMGTLLRNSVQFDISSDEE